jgi:hypothetical protein
MIPVLSVGLALWKAEKIGWLALESLCNQKNINFDWELIIDEEEGKAHYPIDINEMIYYITRLKREQPKCTVRYIPRDHWVTLGQKWIEMIKEASDSSIMFLFQDADCYSQPYRLRETYDLMKSGDVDWCQSDIGLFYNILAKEMTMYKYRDKEHTGLNMAIRTGLGKQFESGKRKKFVNVWLYRLARQYCKGKIRLVYNESPNWVYGVDTHGFNTISHERWSIVEGKSPVFRDTNIKLIDCIPNQVVEKLGAMKEEYEKYIS